MGCFGGGDTTVNAPPMTEEEKSLLATQNDLLKQQLSENKQITPLLMKNLGLKQDETGNWVEMSYQERIDSMDPQEKLALENQMLQYGKDIYGNALTEDQIMARLTPSQQNAYQAEKLSQERYIKALKGELDISPALEQELSEYEKNTKADLERKLGPNWQLSTPGQKALANLEQKTALIREEARRGEITAGEMRSQNIAQQTLAKANQAANETASVAALRQQGLSNLANLPGRTSGLIQTAGTMQQPYMRQRELETSAAMQTAANKAASGSGWMGLLGNMAGAGAMLGSAYMRSSKKVKKDMDKLSDKEEDRILEMIGDGNDVYSYRYKEESKDAPKRIGYMAEEAPPGVATADKTMIDLGKLTGLHAAAIKALTRKVGKLEESRKGA